MVVLRPRALNEAYFAAAGAILMALTGLVGPGDIRAVWDQTSPVLLFLAGIMVVGLLVDQAGVFEWAAGLAARLAGGSNRRLLWLVFGLGFAITSVLSLDATAVVLTPIVVGMTRRLGLNPGPYLFACIYVANTGSLLFPISNLTNLLFVSALQWRFWEFAGWMVLPQLLALAANLGLFLLLFRGVLSGRHELSPAVIPAAIPAAKASAVPPVEAGAGRTGFGERDRLFFGAALATLAGVMVAFGLAQFVGLELWMVAMVAAVLLGLVAWALGRTTPLQVLRQASWSLLPFVFGLFLVVRGAENAGLTRPLGQALLLGSDPSFPRLLGVAALAALGSNLVNNVPMTVLALSALQPLLAQGRLDPAAAYAAVLGTNLGPNLTVVGSLATMLVLTGARRRGVDVSGWHYLRLGMITLPVLLVCAAFGLWLAAALH